MVLTVSLVFLATGENVSDEITYDTKFFSKAALITLGNVHKQGKVFPGPTVAWNRFARRCDDSQTKIVIFKHTAKVED